MQYRSKSLMVLSRCEARRVEEAKEDGGGEMIPVNQISLRPANNKDASLRRHYKSKEFAKTKKNMNGLSRLGFCAATTSGGPNHAGGR